MGNPTHGIGIHALTETTEQWDALYKRFTDLLAEFTGSVPSISIHSQLLDDEDGVEEEGEYYDEFTLFKVVAAFAEAGIDDKTAEQVIDSMKDKGILFRERRAPTKEDLG